jgi:hypothetical protein
LVPSQKVRKEKEIMVFAHHLEKIASLQPEIVVHNVETRNVLGNQQEIVKLDDLFSHSENRYVGSMPNGYRTLKAIYYA